MFRLSFTLIVFYFFINTQASAQAKPKPKPTPSVKTTQAAAPKPKSPNMLIFEDAMKNTEIDSTFAATFVGMAKNFMGHDAYLIRAGNDANRSNAGRVMLQKPGREVLYIDLEIFDCQTYIEYTLALAQTRRLANPSYETFRENVKKLRYRNAVVAYAARLHYFTDWIYENQKQGIVKDVTKEIGGELFQKDVHYMSQKRDTFYGNMADPATFAAVRTVEKNITAREKYYIPKDKLLEKQSKIEEGDIIAITNGQDGMDVAHVGVAYWQGTQLHLLHASSDLGMVVVTQESLSDYLAKHAKHTGVIVARLKE